tara:strand:+ start:143 stop:1819 length:1677 start_codon:yes stop_codon:yes gene_type:complete
MALKPISYYGQFTPTGVDQSGARRMQALAGLGETVAGVAEQFGRAKADELAPEQAQKAAEKAITEGEELKKRNPLAYGATVYNNQLIQGYAAGIQNETSDMIAKVATENPADFTAFQAKVTEGYKGLSANLPVEAKATVDNFFNRSRNTAGNKIIAKQNKIAIDNSKAEIALAGVNYYDEQSNLASEGNAEDLAKSILDQDTAVIVAGPDVVDFKKYYEEKAKRLADYRQAGVLGELRRDIINNPELENKPKEKITILNGALAGLKKSTVLKVADPEDPTKMVNVDEKERKSIITAVESEIKDYKDLVKQQITKNTLLDTINSVDNYMAMSSAVEDTEIDADERLLEINRSEKDGKLKTEQASILRRYVTSEKAVNAKTNSSIYGAIIDRIYGLNSDLSLQANNADYLKGVQSIDEFIKEERTAGNLNRDDELKLNREMRNLTAAKKAGALSMIGLSYTKANKIIAKNTPPELRNTVRARIFNIVQSEIENAEEIGKPLNRADQRDLWSKYALSTSTEVIDEERQRSQDSIRDVLSRTQVAPPTGAVIIKFDAQGNRI